jgi:hypothetical protein
MDRFQIIVLVILVGIQIFRSLKKKMETATPDQESAPDQGMIPDDRDVDTAWTTPQPQAGLRRPVTDPSTKFALGAMERKPVQTGRPRATQAEILRKESLRQHVLGKIILDPPLGLSRLRRLKP